MKPSRASWNPWVTGCPPLAYMNGLVIQLARAVPWTGRPDFYLKKTMFLISSNLEPCKCLKSRPATQNVLQPFTLCPEQLTSLPRPEQMARNLLRAVSLPVGMLHPQRA